MLKRITDKLFVLFASILLVSHAIVPHLHFNNEIFIITPTCINDEEHKQHAPEHNNDEAENDPEYCLLKQIVFARLNDSDTELFKQFVSGDNHPTDSFSAILNYNSFSLYTESFDILPTHLNSSVYTKLVDCHVNPRGSPIV